MLEPGPRRVLFLVTSRGWSTRSFVISNPKVTRSSEWIKRDQKRVCKTINQNGKCRLVLAHLSESPRRRLGALPSCRQARRLLSWHWPLVHHPEMLYCKCLDELLTTCSACFKKSHSKKSFEICRSSTNSWKCPANFPEISWKFPEISRKFPGIFPENFRKFPGNFRGNFPEISRKLPEISWKLPRQMSGNFLEVYR